MATAASTSRSSAPSPTSRPAAAASSTSARTPAASSSRGFFTAGAKLEVGDGKLTIVKEGKTRKFVKTAEHITFSGVLGQQRGQRVTYVTERCVIELEDDGLVVTEIAPGIDLQRDVLDQAEIPLRVSPNLRVMPAALFRRRAVRPAAQGRGGAPWLNSSFNCRRDGEIATVTLARAPKLNSLTPAMLDELERCARELDADTEVRVVIAHG